LTVWAQGVVSVIPVAGIPDVQPGDDLAALVADALRAGGVALQAWDVVVVTHKVVSKAEGRLVRLNGVAPSPRALEIAAGVGRDARLVQVILDESTRVVYVDDRVFVCEVAQGYVLANAGVDVSNVDGGDTAVLLPLDSDATAASLCDVLRDAVDGGELGVIISDTFGRPFRMATTNVALGVAGMPAISDHRGAVDSAGYVMHGSTLATADEIAGAAELVMGKTSGVPVAIVRGLRWAGEGSGAELIRPAEEDVFRP
jgi:coenzyme F420-0:L-glutamate ligase/coenzyme F420-1:gamma-L-glutamate ligase